jgi:AraC-like DNA-binding protein
VSERFLLTWALMSEKQWDVEMEPIRAERQTVTFFDGLQVDGYRMPNGEFRVGVTGASIVLGYSENWLSRLLGRETGTSIKTLRGLGFTEETQKVVSETSRGDREAQTINLRDFNRLISYAVFDGKRAALALQLALTEVALNDFFRDAFGEPPLSIDEKRRIFYESYAATISPEEWRQMDREDILRLAILGDGTRKNEIEEGFWNT